ncbi:MAG: class I SAM-dependent methyltransferase [Pedobacter sp.]|nr:MAG: class I SAM-dependent methyltransferase [Pedobacter sp.]
MLNNYDKIAKRYDSLSRLIYGKAQVNAQINQLKYIPENSSILIAGGGTGWILEEISKIQSIGLKITYVEISGNMINLSKARNVQDNEVKFVNIGVEDFTSEELFDVVLTPFLFDNFSAERAKVVFKKLDEMLRDNGLWLLVDFNLNGENGKWWKWIMLKSMYVFFKLLKIVEANKLTDMEPQFLTAKYQVLEERFYYGRFIKASVFKK